MNRSKRLQKGREMRTKVLGQEYVEKTIGDADEFDMPFQQIITEFVWGEIWSRPGLDLKTRSLCTIAVLAALGRWPLLRIHTIGAVNNGASKEEIREVLLHIALYAGFPATAQAIKEVKEVLAESEKSKTG